MIQVTETKTAVNLPSETTKQERNWAALAHFSAILTLLLAIGSGGLGAIPFAFVPLVIYLSFKEKSKFVAFHAAQAVALQVVGSVGYFLFILAGILSVALVWVVSAVLVVILVGILLLILVAPLVTAAIAIAIAAAPFVLGVLSIVGGIEAYNGREYRYPYLGNWVADWLAKMEQAQTPPV